MFRRMFEFAWLAVLCLPASAAFGQAPSAAVAAQSCDKVCQQQRLDGLFKAMDAAESSQRPKPSNSTECAAYDGREHSDVRTYGAEPWAGLASPTLGSAMPACVCSAMARSYCFDVATGRGRLTLTTLKPA